MVEDGCDGVIGGDCKVEDRESKIEKGRRAAVGGSGEVMGGGSGVVGSEIHFVLWV